MNIRDVGAISNENRQDLNNSNLSHHGGRPDLMNPLNNIHSNSQMVLSQLHQSQKYTNP